VASFLGILHDLRADLAREYLSDASLNLAEIACVLGYAEVSAFSFACKRFPGKTPSQARRRSLAESRKTLAGIRSLRLAVIY